MNGRSVSLLLGASLLAASIWCAANAQEPKDDARIATPAELRPVTDMALVPGGFFRMGDDPGEGCSDERPVHSVFVSAFYVEKYEVTKSLWDEVTSWGQSHSYDLFALDAKGNAPGHPAFNASWYEAVKWANARSEKEGLTPCYTVNGSVYRTGEAVPRCNWSASGYRLPTEAEWEKAARGGAEGRRFPWSDTDTIGHARANYKSSASFSYDTSLTRGYHPDYDNAEMPYTNPAGSFEPNGYGLYDMAGDLCEWCWDWYSESYYQSSPLSDPRGPVSGSYRVKRGGSWNYYAGNCRVADRNYNSPEHGHYYLGFRLVRNAL